MLGKYKWGTHQIAFGPYLALAAYICLFAGYDIVNWYLQLTGLGKAAGG